MDSAPVWVIDRSIPIPNEIKNMANSIGVKIKGVKLKDSTFHNAYAIGRSPVLGVGLLKDLGCEECKAVVAHELGHIKERHSMVRILLMAPLLAVPLFTWSTVYSPNFFSIDRLRAYIYPLSPAIPSWRALRHYCAVIGKIKNARRKIAYGPDFQSLREEFQKLSIFSPQSDGFRTVIISF